MARELFSKPAKEDRQRGCWFQSGERTCALHRLFPLNLIEKFSAAVARFLGAFPVVGQSF